MNPMDPYQILRLVSVINRDNGKRFTRTDRLDAITAILWDSRYRRINSEGLFHLYAARPLEAEADHIIVISSHVDCHPRMTRCFTRLEDGCLMRGTYDNAVTNAAVLSAMLSGSLPDNVLVCFSGDEENDSRGADDLADYLEARCVHPDCVIVLDVTDMGWDEQADFTIENNFWPESLGRQAIGFARESGCSWRFVPSDPDHIPSYVDSGHLIPKEAEPDESWEYDEKNLPCFSFCLPVLGEMHGDLGVLASRNSFERYIRALGGLVRALCAE